jgi:LacI family transcriptional regulator
MPAPRVTLKDIATACGVSVMTVSRVLRKQRHVKAGIRERVEAAAERLGYRPDPGLSALVRHRQQVREGKPTGERLTLIVPEEKRFGWGSYPILTELEADIGAEAGRLGYQFQRMAIPADGRQLGPTLHKLYNKGIRGLMIAPEIDISGIAAKSWDDFVVVALGPGALDAPFHGIRNDFFQMAKCAAETLQKMGHRRLGYLASEADLYTGYRALGALLAHDRTHPATAVEVFDIPTWAESPPKGYLTWIRRFRPTAIVSIGKKMLPWHENWITRNKPGIEFVQLNRPRWDPSVHGVCTPPTVHGTLVAQRLHQLLLDDARGIPEARAVVRVDGYWAPAHGRALQK